MFVLCFNLRCAIYQLILQFGTVFRCKNCTNKHTNAHKICNFQNLKMLQVAGGYISHYLLGNFFKYLFRKSRKELEKIKPWVFIRSLKSNIFGKFAGKVNTDFFKLQIVCPKKMGCYTLQNRKTEYWGLTTF